MAKIRIHLSDNVRAATWFCPGCNYNHTVYIAKPNPWGYMWHYNENPDKPTLTPSVDGGEPKCHSIMTDGNLQFLPDCQHSLAGKTVPMLDIT